MKVALVAGLVGFVASHFDGKISPKVLDAFQMFTEKYNKTYASDEEWTKRVGIFATNLAMVSDMNNDHILAGGEAVFGITKFMDLSKEEFKATYLTYKPVDKDPTQRVHLANMTKTPLADSLDWRDKKAVTPVKDQGQCGSCWAFSATEAIESFAFLNDNAPLEKLSPQQITSCDKVDQGCGGGNTETAYKYVQKAGGLVSADDYPYTSGTKGKNGKCKKKIGKKIVTIDGFKSVAKGEDNLKASLNLGPVSVCVAADAFQTYDSGILHKCPGDVDHCVQAVGYNTEENYWLVRNSWNTDWGEDGYIRVKMGKNLCKISSDVTYPTFGTKVLEKSEE